MKKLFIITILLAFTGLMNAQIVTKQCTGYKDTVWAYDSLAGVMKIDQITTTKLIVLGIEVTQIKLKKIDTAQEIVIAEGFYDASGSKIEGTENRYYFFLQRIPFAKLTQSDINQLKNN